LRKSLQSAGVTLLVLGYPIFAYLAISHGISWLFPAIIGVLFLQRVRKGGEHAPVYVIIGLLLLAGALFFQEISAKMLPVLIHFSMLLLFFSSLRTEASIIERFARLDFPELPPGIATYCRKLTWLWSGFFLFNILFCAGLAIWADDHVWALYNGAVIYLLLGLLVAGEYIWRRLRFPWLEVPPFRQSVMNMIRNGHTVWGNKS